MMASMDVLESFLLSFGLSEEVKRWACRLEKERGKSSDAFVVFKKDEIRGARKPEKPHGVCRENILGLSQEVHRRKKDGGEEGNGKIWKGTRQKLGN